MRPTHVRHWVVVLGVSLAMITYIDRACLSQAAPLVMRDLHFTKVQLSYAFSAFTLAYALFEIPGGWMGDLMGPRKVLLRVVTWWSACTAAIGWVWNVPSLVAVNFLFGAGEAGAFPNLTRAFTNWLPTSERSRAQGIMWMAARWGGAVTPLLVVWVLEFVTWRQAFQIFGAVGVIWAIFFYRWFRDNPRDHKSVNEAELALLEGAARAAKTHGKVPWRKLFGSTTARLLWIQYFCVSYVFWFYLQWLPTYLMEYRHMDPHRAARFAVFPLLFGGVGCILAGMLTPRISRWVGGLKTGRRVIGAVGLGCAGVLMLLHTRIEDALPAMVVLGLASMGNDISIPGAWATCMDVGGRFSGTLSGSMNMMGNFGGVAASLVLGHVLQATGNWLVIFYIMAGVYVVGALCWVLIDPVTPIEGTSA